MPSGLYVAETPAADAGTRCEEGEMNNLALVQALAFEPRTAFAELDARPRYWWPLLVLSIVSGVMAYWYMSVVDLEWLVHQQMSSSSVGANMTDEEIARLARQAAEQQGFRAVLAGCINVISVPLGMLLSALYFVLAGKVTGVERSFRHWYALSCWINLPMLLGVELWSGRTWLFSFLFNALPWLVIYGIWALIAALR
jgi:hypothetical protein